MISKFKMVKVSKTTFAMVAVNGGKIIYLIQNGQITQDPLKVRYFQRMV